MRDYSKSLEWYERAKLWTPDASQTMSKSPMRYPVGAHPLALSRGDGCHVWDLDENKYIDWSLGLAAVTLGYDYPSVTYAIQCMSEAGCSFSLPHYLESEVAERICGIFPCANNGAVRFVKTGSEADSAACRIARRATGRDVILACGYLGWHDWAMSRAKEHPGVPDVRLRGTKDWPCSPVIGFDPGGVFFAVGTFDESWEWDKVAAIFVEPPLFPPQWLDIQEMAEGGVQSWLQSLKDLAHDHGSLLIFDEIVYGGRFALGGGQEFFGVTPDLCTFGKGLANGMPLAGVAGPRQLMQYADVISGTFGGETLSLAACKATLDVYQREPVINRMWIQGAKFYVGLQEQLAAHGLPAVVEGYCVHPRLKWLHECDTPAEKAEDAKRCELRRLLMSLWLQELAEGGVLVHPGGWNVSHSHTDEDVERSLKASDKAFAKCAEALRDGDVKKWLRGEVIQEGFKVR